MMSWQPPLPIWSNDGFILIYIPCLRVEKRRLWFGSRGSYSPSSKAPPFAIGVASNSHILDPPFDSRRWAFYDGFWLVGLSPHLVLPHGSLCSSSISQHWHLSLINVSGAPRFLFCAGIESSRHRTSCLSKSVFRRCGLFLSVSLRVHNYVC